MADSAKDFIVKQNLKVVGNIISAGAGSVFTGDGSQLNDVDAVTLGGESGGFYRDATNLNAGTVSNDRLPATITKNISGNVTGNVDATGGSGTVDADSGRFTTISGTTANFTSYTGLFGGNLQSFDSALDSSFTRQSFKDTVFDAVFDSSLGRKSADDISDGATNKFYTTARFDSDFGTKTTTELSEGNNLYYTKVRVDSDIGLKVDKTFVDALNINADQVDGVEAASFVRSDQDDTVGANLTFTDGNELRLGTASDTIIKHTGTATTVNHTGTGKLILQADETDRLSVTDSGVEIDGELYADSIYANGYIVAAQDIEAMRDVYVDNQLWIYESANGGIAGHLEGTAAGGLEIHYHSITPDAGLSIYAHDSQALVGTLQAKFTATEGISFENDIVHLVADPVVGTDVANKRYVDNTAQGLTVKDAARVATTAAFTGATYFNTAGPDSGVGAGFDFSPGLDSLDSIPLVAGNRILVKDQALPFQNGIYVYDSSTRITRATDADSHGELSGGVFVFIEEGATQASNGYVTSHSINNHKVGADSVVWTQFSGAGFIEAGGGLVKSGNTLDINLNATSSGLVITSDELLVNAGSGLTITSNTLKVPDDGIKDFHIDFGTGSNQVSTTDVPEGTNEYYTTAKARAAVSGGNGINYDSSTGVISTSVATNSGTFGSASAIPIITVDSSGLVDSVGTVPVAGVDSVDYDSTSGRLTLTLGDASTKDALITLDPFTTTNLTEGTNLYYTNARVASYIDSSYLDDFVIPISREGYDSGQLAPFARSAISVSGDGITYNQETGVITVQTVTNSFQITQSSHELKEGNAVYEDDTLGWIRALATDSGQYLATHIVVEFVDSNNFKIAQNGIFTFETANPGKAQTYTSGEYYYLSATDSGLSVDVQPNTSVQPLFYALDSNQVELNVEHAVNVFSPDEPINVSRTAGNFTVTGNLKVEGLGVPRVTTLSSGDTYSFDSGNVAKIEFSADASLVFDSPGTTYDGAGFTILAKNTDGSNTRQLTLTTPNGVTLNTVNDNQVTVNAGKFAIISGLIYGEKDIILTSTQTDSAITG